MININAMGLACPLPVVNTLNVIRGLTGPETLEITVDNQIAVENLTRMATQKGFPVASVQTGDKAFTVTIQAGPVGQEGQDPQWVSCQSQQEKKIVVAISSATMGIGSDELGKVLLKGFIYALGQQEQLPKAILFYNGGATVTCTEGPSVEDLKALASRGVEILTCGTCLKHYGLEDKLLVGGVTNMYDIVERLTQADTVIKP